MPCPLFFSFPVPHSDPQIYALTLPLVEVNEEVFECLVATATRDTVTLQWVLYGQPDIGSGAEQMQEELPDGRVRVRSLLKARFSRNDNQNYLRCISTVVDYTGANSSSEVEQQLNVTCKYRSVQSYQCVHQTEQLY